MPSSTRSNRSIVQTRIATPLGDMTIAASPLGLAGMWFHDQRHLPPQLSNPPEAAPWPEDDANPILQDAARQIGEYFAGTRSEFDIAFDLSCGTDFQQAVWKALLDIPCGKTTSYGAIARSIGKPQAVRAVGAAVGRNPVSVLVPCHRVMGKDGALTGYAGGLDRKIALLKLEHAAAP